MAKKQKQIGYLRWRDRLSEITPNDMRIGEDILLISGKNYQDLKSGAFRVDVATAIIYLRGSVRIRVNMREFLAEAPCLVVIPPDIIVECLDVSENAITRVIVMSKAFLDNILATQNNNPTSLYKHIVDNPVIGLTGEEEALTSFYLMLKKLIRDSHSPWRLEAARHLTLALFYAYSASKHNATIEPVAKGRKDEICEAFIELLRANYMREREVRFYADRLCISPKYLSRVVKESSGRQPSEWIDDYVITESKALLSSTTLSVQQISDRLNFPSQSLFGKYFKRATGLSPRDYRKGV